MQKLNYYKKISFFVAGIIFLSFSGYVRAQSIGNEAVFNVDANFDVSGRQKISAKLVDISNNLYFYVEKAWWDSQKQATKDSILANLDSLGGEFNNNIYPKLTSVFGFEEKPGIDGDEKITVLFHPMKGSDGGYFREADEYEKIQISNSNEREMLYISTYLMTLPKMKNVLAHEFVHLETFNQKNTIFKVQEETWLNEARADYSSTILGYDTPFDLSNLQSRMKDFAESPSDSITEWQDVKYDYASVSMLTHYMVDQYGINILSDSLKSKYSGIDSINYALEKSGHGEKFAGIFTDWTIASILNDCSLDSKYCYRNKDLSNLKIVPNINFLPVSGNASLSVVNVVKNWAGTWQKFIGGNGDFKLEFSASSGLNFVVPYVLEDKNGNRSVSFLSFDNNKKGIIDIPNFGTDYKSLIIIPSLQNEISGLNDNEFAYPFNFSVVVGGELLDQNQLLIQQLLARIEDLKQQIAKLQQNNFCSSFNSDLYFGMANNESVRCLQGFLKNQGAGIYPEGLMTGNFGSLTKQAVIRFQEKYTAEILTPVGLSSGTGYVGEKTRQKINQML